MEANRKKAKVHMLPTEDVSQIHSLRGELTYSFVNTRMSEGLGTTPMEQQHLYFTSDEDIKVGDWGYCSKTNKVFKCDVIVPYKDAKTGKQVSFLDDSLKKSFQKEDCRKIIASTDPKLTMCESCRDYDKDILPNCKCYNPITWKVAQPSQAFIKKYVEKGGIDEVWVDYYESIIEYGDMILVDTNEDQSYFHAIDVEVEFSESKEYLLSKGGKYYKSKLKVNSHNEIAIHEVVEKMYTREEMEANVTLGMIYMNGYIIRNTTLLGQDARQLAKDFIKENL